MFIRIDKIKFFVNLFNVLLQVSTVNRIQACNHLISALGFFRLKTFKFDFRKFFLFFYFRLKDFFLLNDFFFGFLLLRLSFVSKNFFKLILKDVSCFFVEICKSYILNNWFWILDTEIINRFEKCFCTKRFWEAEDTT